MCKSPGLIWQSKPQLEQAHWTFFHLRFMEMPPKSRDG